MESPDPRILATRAALEQAFDVFADYMHNQWKDIAEIDAFNTPPALVSEAEGVLCKLCRVRVPRGGNNHAVAKTIWASRVKRGMGSVLFTKLQDIDADSDAERIKNALEAFVLAGKCEELPGKSRFFGEMGKWFKALYAYCALLCEQKNAGNIAEGAAAVVKQSIGGAGRGADPDQQAVIDKFSEWDANGDGKLQREEWEMLFKDLNSDFKAADIRALFDLVDKDGGGDICIEEFLAWLFGDQKVHAAPAPEAASAPKEVAGDPPPDEWAQVTLAAHNAYRAKHGAPPLGWSNECFEFATKQAAKMQGMQGLDHDNMDGPSGKHGQNCFGGRGAEWPAERAVKAWYDEVTDPGYDFANQGFSMGTGHFTQVVWKETRLVGMARSANGNYICANYLPGGNMAGDFEKNVFPEGTAMQARAKTPAELIAEGAVKFGTLEAKEWSDDIPKYLELCPWADDFGRRIKEALQEGKTVQIDRKEKELMLKFVGPDGRNLGGIGGPWTHTPRR